MSIPTEITRLNQAKSDLKTVLESKGFNIPSNVKIDEYYKYIQRLPDFDFGLEPLTFEILSDGDVCFTSESVSNTLTIQYSKNGGEWTNLTSTFNQLYTISLTVNGKSGTYTYGGYDGQNMGMYYWENGNDRLYYFDSATNINDYMYDSSWNSYSVLTCQNNLMPYTTSITVDGKSGTYTYGGYDNQNMWMHYWVNGNDKVYNNSYYITTNDSVIDNNYDSYTVLTTQNEVIGGIPVVNGDIVQFRGNNSTYYYNYHSTTFKGTSCRFNVYGNIMSLINSTNFTNLTTLTNNRIFTSLFEDISGLLNAENLVLPATTLTEQCYQYMFSGCTSLTTLPNLPATTLAVECYNGMFSGCSSLTTIPSNYLQATTLANYCYNGMFRGCSSLTTLPNLPVTTLANYCYENMFSGCSSLTILPNLPATTLVEGCYENMFSGCSSLTTIPSNYLQANSLTYECYCGMFKNCTSLTTAPALPATTLANNCYKEMFKGCTSLTILPSLSAQNLVYGCYSYMFQDCTSLTTIPSNYLPATTLVNNCYYCMFYGCTSLTTLPNLPATTLMWQCYLGMFRNCTSLTTVPSNLLPATTLASSCYQDMFEGCTSLTTAPDLPATTLASQCYCNMFNNCSSLNYIKCLATDISASSCTSNWVSGVAVTGTFVKDANMSSWTTGISGIPSGWTVQLIGIGLSRNNFILYETGGTEQITVISVDNSWTATTENNWITLSQNSGSTGETTITITVSSTSSHRTGSVLFSDGSKSVTLTVLQNDNLLKPLTFEITNSGTIYWKKVGSPTSRTLQYKLNNGTLTDLTPNNSISVTTGDVVEFYGNADTYASHTSAYHTFSDSTAEFNVKGNIMSLIDKNNYSTLTKLTNTYTFYFLFRQSKVKNAENLQLTATTLTSSCYNSMFFDCTSLTTAPELPVTTLASSCYTNMFYNCTSLTTAPELPATTLASSCYTSMFNSCTSLTTAPELPATTLASSCYSHMFYNCTSLTTAPELPATTLTNYCYQGMFSNCSSLNYIKCLATDISASGCTSDWVYYVAQSGKFIKHNNMTSWTTGTSGIPSGWTSMNDPDKTPLTFEALENGTFSFSTNSIQYSIDDGSTWSTLTAGSSTPTVTAGNKIMFKATGLTPTYSSGIGTFSSTGNFNAFGNVMSLYYGDDFINQTSLYGKTYAFYKLFYNCSNLISAENLVLPATTLANYCYGYMFYRCTLLTKVPKLPATTLANYCYMCMFYGCSTLTTVQELTATSLTTGCYSQMFSNCTSLNYIKCLATDISASGCTNSWLYDVAATGTFISSQNMNYWSIGDSGIPFGWCINISLSKNGINVQETGGTEQITVISKYNSWTATTENNWITLSQNSGSVGETTITITVSSTSSPRTGSVLFSDGSNSTTLTVTQNNYLFIPLTFEITNSGTIYWKAYNTETPITIQYKKNNGSLTNLIPDNSISVVTGDVVEFYGNTDTYAAYSNTTKYHTFQTSTAEFNIKGNIMSLINKDNYSSLVKLTNTYTFCYLFRQSNVKSAKNLQLPKILTKNCYTSLFDRCTLLTEAPELPTTTLAYECYMSMFYGCSSLTTAPELPATTLASGCYRQMFKGCTSLTTPPTLPATTLANYCYGYMFDGCTTLKISPTLPATTLISNCYYYMFNGCTSLTTAPELPATTLAIGCYSYMFQGCSSLTTAPELPATTLESNCYYQMFKNCTHLNYIKCLATNISASNCTYDWVNSVSTTGTFVKDNNMSSWATGTNGIPTGWNINFGLNKNNIGFYKTGGTEQITFISNNSWTATPQNNWITLSQNSGSSGETDITITVSSTSSPRTGSVIFSDGSRTVTLTVTQSIPLTFEILANGTIYWNKHSLTIDKTIQYKKNNGTLTNLSPNSSISVVTGDVVEFYGTHNKYANATYNSLWYSFENSTAEFNVKGNIMSLIDKDNYPSLTVLTESNTFPYFFKECKIKSAENLQLPATILVSSCYYCMFYNCTSLTKAPTELPAPTLASGCYEMMFQSCTSLTTVPVLPATTLAYQCYEQMFYSCTALTTPPVLPATTLANWCYYGMFRGCTALTTAPELPATTLTESCYGYMFAGCTSLNNIKCLATNISASSCTTSWVSNVSSLGTFVKDSNMSSWTTGISGIPSGWTVTNNT